MHARQCFSWKIVNRDDVCDRLLGDFEFCDLGGIDQSSPMR